MVIRPAVPPYSSTTIAMWVRAACISRSRSSTGLDSGTKVAVRMSTLTGVSGAARTASLR